MSLTDIFEDVGGFLEGAENVVQKGVSIFDNAKAAVVNTTAVANPEFTQKIADQAINTAPSATGSTAGLTTGNNTMMLVVIVVAVLLLSKGG